MASTFDSTPHLFLVLARMPKKPYSIAMVMERKPINRFNDALMKYVFADSERKHITLSLINAVFALEERRLSSISPSGIGKSARTTLRGRNRSWISLAAVQTERLSMLKCRSIGLIPWANDRYTIGAVSTISFTGASRTAIFPALSASTCWPSTCLPMQSFLRTGTAVLPW